MPLVVRIEPSGKVTPLSLDNVNHASVSLADAPASDPSARQNPRTHDHHRYGLRERQPAGGGHVERGVVVGTALDSLSVQRGR